MFYAFEWSVDCEWRVYNNYDLPEQSDAKEDAASGECGHSPSGYISSLTGLGVRLIGCR